jgi:hypothetical protein
MSKIFYHKSKNFLADVLKGLVCIEINNFKFIIDKKMIKCPLGHINSFRLTCKESKTIEKNKNNRIVPALEKTLVYYVDGDLAGKFTPMDFQYYKSMTKYFKSGSSDDITKDNFYFDRLYIRYSNVSASSQSSSSTASTSSSTISFSSYLLSNGGLMSSKKKKL